MTVAQDDMRSTSTWKRCWNSGRVSGNVQTRSIFRKLLEEKLGYELPIDYEDWIAANHYGLIRPEDARWLYRQEQGYVESMKNVTVKELAEQRIAEFTGALRKYIL